VSEALAVLQRIRVGGARRLAPDPERCDVCSEPLPEGHGHLVDVEARAILCACRGCYLLFTPDGAGGGHFKAVPDRYLDVGSDAALRQAWEEMQVPVGMAFFFTNSRLGRPVACYPGPAGATESELPPSGWEKMLEGVEADVEALLVRSGRQRGFEAFVVPIDVCYELVGRLRRLWRGFDGGPEAAQAVDGLFGRVRACLR
jgi:hypothetical protein